MKRIAIAKITTPADVQAQLALTGDVYDKGAIFVEIAEEGMTNQLIYCRYGLSIPYYEVQVNEKVLVEHTSGTEIKPERFFYTGIVDSTGTIPTESYALGNKLQTELEIMKTAISQLQTDFSGWTPVPNDGGAALKTAVTTGFVAEPLPDFSESNILSEVIKGK